MDRFIKKAIQGDPDAFTELMQSQMQMLYKVAWTMLKNDADAADAVSDTILACWEKMGQLRQPEYFKTWMTRILINNCNSILRTRTKVSITHEIGDVTSIDTSYDNAEWKEVLHALGEKYQTVMILYYVEGFSTNDISHILNLPDSTVRSRLSRGRKQLTEVCDTDRRKMV